MEELPSKEIGNGLSYFLLDDVSLSYLFQNSPGRNLLH